MPCHHPQDIADWIKLGLTNSLYGGAFNSRLVMNIREDKGYTYSPRSGVHALRQHGYFSVSAAVRSDVVAASLTEMFYEMDKLRSLPVPEPELADARNYLSGIFSMGLATQDGLLGQLATVALERSARRLPRDLPRQGSLADASRLARRPPANISTPPTCKSSSSATAPKSKIKPNSSATSKSSTPKAIPCNSCSASLRRTPTCQSLRSHRSRHNPVNSGFSAALFGTSPGGSVWRRTWSDKRNWQVPL